IAETGASAPSAEEVAELKNIAATAEGMSVELISETIHRLNIVSPDT
ncbi:hypothetical protein KIPB_014208, partial [Kipferlia bialata]